MNKKTKHVAVFLSISILLFALSLLTPTSTVEAGGGIGSVWATGVTETTITISWTPPSGKYRLSGSTPYYKICYKKAGAWVGSCSGGTVAYTNSSSYTITGLDSNTSYKIKVKCHCEKKNWRGKWKNPKWRKIATLTQSTNDSPPAPDTRHGNIKVIGATSSSLDVEVTYSHPGDFDFIRVCYKKTWNIASLNGTCSGINDPVNNWEMSTAERGWIDVTSISPLQVAFHSLKSCRQYKVVAYGFWPNSSTGVKIGKAKGHTTGNCRKLFKISQAVVADHTHDVLMAYAENVEAVYRRPLFDHLAEQYDQGLYEVYKSLLQDEDEDLMDTPTMLAFLIETDSEILTAWQEEEALRQAEMTLDAFVSREYPDLYQMLLEELEPPSATLTCEGAEGYLGDTLHVNLVADGEGNHVYGLQVSATIDPAIAAPDSATFGDFFDSPYLAAINHADAAAGTWDGAVSQQNPNPPVTGGGTFATVTYQAISTGSTDVILTPLFSDRDGFELDGEVDGCTITVLDYGTINGTVTYQGRLTHANIDVVATGAVTNNDLTDSNGDFDIGSLPADSYDVEADAHAYLPACTTTDVTSGQISSLPQAQLLGGDVAGDNNDSDGDGDYGNDEVNIGDATLISGAFGSSNTQADINADGIINVQDLSILGGNYDVSGCQDW